MGPQPVAQRHAGDTAMQLKSCGDELGAPEVVGANKETPGKHTKGNKGCSTKKVTRPTAQMKCLYMNAGSTGNKQEELEATVLLESYDLIAVTETWWDESRGWSVAIDGYRLFRRDRQGQRGRGVAGSQVKSPVTGRRETLHPFLKRVERRILGVTSLPASPLCLGRSWNRSF